MVPIRVRFDRGYRGVGFGLLFLLLVTGVATASGPPYGIPSGVTPLEYYKYYKGYNEPSHQSAARQNPPAVVTQAPRKYTIQVSLVPARYVVQVAQAPVRRDADEGTAALVMAHVPEDASIWFDDAATLQKGAIRYFESPLLKPTRSYSYSARVVWFEDGQWVTQTVRLPVAAGEIRCLYIVGADQAKELAKVTANMEKLGLEDQKLASLQRNCAVQTDKSLGSMGVPVKIMVKGDAVFLCCDGCVKQAVENPDQTLERLRKAKAEKGHGPKR